MLTQRKTIDVISITLIILPTISFLLSCTTGRNMESALFFVAITAIFCIINFMPSVRKNSSIPAFACIYTSALLTVQILDSTTAGGSWLFIFIVVACARLLMHFLKHPISQLSSKVLSLVVALAAILSPILSTHPLAEYFSIILTGGLIYAGCRLSLLPWIKD